MKTIMIAAAILMCGCTASKSTTKIEETKTVREIDIIAPVPHINETLKGQRIQLMDPKTEETREIVVAKKRSRTSTVAVTYDPKTDVITVDVEPDSIKTKAVETTTKTNTDTETEETTFLGELLTFLAWAIGAAVVCIGIIAFIRTKLL